MRCACLTYYQPRQEQASILCAYRNGCTSEWASVNLVIQLLANLACLQDQAGTKLPASMLDQSEALMERPILYAK